MARGLRNLVSRCLSVPASAHHQLQLVRAGCTSTFSWTEMTDKFQGRSNAPRNSILVRVDDDVQSFRNLTNDFMGMEFGAPLHNALKIRPENAAHKPTR